MSRPWRTCEAVLDRGHVEVDAGKIFDQHRAWRAALKPSKSLDVSQAAFACVDHCIGTGFLRHERYELIMIADGAVRTIQRARVPLSTAAAAAEMALSLDAAHLGKSRQ